MTVRAQAMADPQAPAPPPSVLAAPAPWLAALWPLRFAPAATWAGAIWFASSFDWSQMRWPQDGDEGLGIGRWVAGMVSALWSALDLPIAPDKAVHACVFGLLALLLALPSRLPPLPRLAVAIALATAWGAIDEVHQAYVPGRSSDIWDLVADACGAALAVGGFELAARGRARWRRMPS